MTNDSNVVLVRLWDCFQTTSSRRRPLFPFLSFICFLTNICLTRHTLLYRITLPQPVHNVPIQRLRVYGAMCSPSTSRISENFLKKKASQGRISGHASPCVDYVRKLIAFHCGIYFK